MQLGVFTYIALHVIRQVDADIFLVAFVMTDADQALRVVRRGPYCKPSLAIECAHLALVPLFLSLQNLLRFVLTRRNLCAVIFIAYGGAIFEWMGRVIATNLLNQISDRVREKTYWKR